MINPYKNRSGLYWTKPNNNLLRFNSLTSIYSQSVGLPYPMSQIHDQILLCLCFSTKDDDLAHRYFPDNSPLNAGKPHIISTMQK